MGGLWCFVLCVCVCVLCGVVVRWAAGVGGSAVFRLSWCSLCASLQRGAQWEKMRGKNRREEDSGRGRGQSGVQERRSLLSCGNHTQAGETNAPRFQSALFTFSRISRQTPAKKKVGKKGWSQSVTRLLAPITVLGPV